MLNSHSQGQDIQLSICIPTYNFGKYLAATLDSILCQMKPNMEIVIVDGASTDNTEEIVKNYQIKYPQIVYDKLLKKGGIDRDMARSVELARGKYCWLFSSDDIMKPDSISKIYHEVVTGLDIYLVGFTIHSLDFKEIVCKHPIFDNKNDIVFDLRKRLERKLFFSQAVTTTAFFSFMSSLIIKKSTWRSAKENDIEEFYGSCWAHVARYFSIISTLTIKYLPESYLEKRDGNDSFLDKGLIHRIGIAIVGFNRMANKFLGYYSKDAAQVRRVLRNEFHWSLMVHLYNIANSKQERLEVRRLSRLLFSGFSRECLISKAKITVKISPVLNTALTITRKYEAKALSILQKILIVARKAKAKIARAIHQVLQKR